MENAPLNSSPLDSSTLDPRRRKLLYQARHRGTKEADRIIGGYVERYIATMNEATLDELETFLSWPDPEILDWLLGLAPIPESRDSALFRAMRDSL